MNFSLNIIAALIFLSCSAHGMVTYGACAANLKILLEIEAPLSEFKNIIESNNQCLLERDTSGRTILINAVYSKRNDVVELILKSSNFVGVNDLDPVTNFSALHISALFGNKQIIMAIVEHHESEIDLAVPVVYHTPLHLAAQGGFTECFQYLETKGANPDTKNLYGESPRTLLEESTRQ